MSTPVDPNSQNGINADKIAFVAKMLKKARDFVEKVYIPDVLAVAPFYLDWAGIGGGVGNFLSYGDFPEAGGNDVDSYFYPRGVIMGKDLANLMPFDEKKVTEYVTNSWYNYEGGDDKGLHPYEGETTHNYTGPKPPYEWLDTNQKYSWVKSPRYMDQPMEVGPLARNLVAYAAGVPEVKGAVDFVLKTLNAPATALFSTLGRTAGRAIDCLVMAQRNEKWLTDLANNIATGDYEVHNKEKWDPATWPKEAQGYGTHEAPRGALGHWIRIENQKIANYQAVVPSTWNAGPRDPMGQKGPYESALIGTPIANPEKPVEILRTIHSFDPCLACAVHVMDGNGSEIIRVKAL
jgi:[NiFe] hydrogenase large subunit/hydrogenase large subunit